MFRRSFLVPLTLGLALTAPLLSAGCASHARYYDDYYADYHPWDAGEARAYRAWLAERHMEYVEFSRLSKERLREYWRWRHEHPDRY
jgi:hypothetical protein